MNDGNWYIVETVPQGEYRAARALRRSGYRVYVPKMRRDERNRRTGRWRRVHVQLMPGYIFVRLTRYGHDGLPDWMALKTADGVTSVLGYGNSPTAFPRHLVREIMVAQRRRVHDDVHRNGDMRRQQLESEFPVGTLARIVDGPFGGLTMVVTGIPNQAYVAGILTGWGVEIKVDAAHVERERTAKAA